MQFKNIAVVSVAATISAVALGTVGAQAAGNVWDSSNIKNGSLLSVDFSPEAKAALKGDAGAQVPRVTQERRASPVKQGIPGTPGQPRPRRRGRQGQPA